MFSLSHRLNGLPCIFTHAGSTLYRLDDYSSVVQCIHHTITDLYRRTGGHTVAKLCKRVLGMARSVADYMIQSTLVLDSRETAAR